MCSMYPLYQLEIIILDIATLFFVLACLVVSILKIRLITTHSGSIFWIWLLPAVLAWSSMVRFLYVLTSLGIVNPEYTPYISSMQVVFYTGLLIFLCDFYWETKKISEFKSDICIEDIDTTLAAMNQEVAHKLLITSQETAAALLKLNQETAAELLKTNQESAARILAKQK